MKILVSVKTNSKLESIERQDHAHFLIRIRVPPVEGKANERIIELLAEYFHLPKKAIVLISGSKGKKKIFEITPTHNAPARSHP